MANKELKKLNRRELVDVIYQLKKNEEHLQAQIASLEAQLQDKRIHLTSAGSIAEAAADITGLFAAAQAAADLYLQEIAHLKEDTELACQQLLADAQAKAEAMAGHCSQCPHVRSEDKTN